jgi:DNA-binding SARP family transcriptional activator
VATVRALPGEVRDRRVRLAFGDALALVGENDAALAEFATLAGGTGPVDPAIAWRHGAVHYHRAERDAALAALARGKLADGNTRDEAMLLATSATVHWSVGAADECGALADHALRVATAAGDHRALAAARVALALHAVLVGDRNANAAHYDAASRHAELGRDAVQLARIRANQAALLLEEARFPEGLAAAGRAVAAAEASGQAAVLALTLVNEAGTLTRLGRLAEAEQRYQRAVTINQLAGSRMVAYPLTGLGDLHAIRGAWGLARAAYEEAVRAADTDSLQQCLVPALAGLARVTAIDDPLAGQKLAVRAVEAASGLLRTRALVAAGWVALAAGEPAKAVATARSAGASARRHRDRAGLADSLELLASADPDPAGAREALREAARTWHGTGSKLDADRVAYLLGQLPGATEQERLAGQLARARLEGMGVAVPAGPLAPRVAVRTLGRFEVAVAGRPVPTSAWQSRKARDLLRILVARRGRMVPREELGTLLWGDDDPARVSHRLSVALSTLRSVLDPERRSPPDHYLVATSGGIRLDLARVTVDVESFLAGAALGLRLHQRGEHTDAYTVLAAAEQGYTGDFCEDDPYQDWAAPTREEARAAYLRVLRALADVATRLGRIDEAVGHLLRILHLDRYDEPGHRTLVALLTAAGRHGEAHRALVRYQEAMRQLGLPPPAGS